MRQRLQPPHAVRQPVDQGPDGAAGAVGDVEVVACLSEAAQRDVGGDEEVDAVRGGDVVDGGGGVVALEAGGRGGGAGADVGAGSGGWGREEVGVGEGGGGGDVCGYGEVVYGDGVVGHFEVWRWCERGLGVVGRLRRWWENGL